MMNLQSFYHTDTLFLLFCAGIVLISAKRRFDPAADARRSTTFFKYVTSLCAYCFSVVLIFFLLTLGISAFPQILRSFFDVRSIIDTKLTWLFALVLTISLNNIPYLSSIDRRLVSIFRYLARIPVESLMLSAVLRRAQIDPPRSLQHDIQAEFDRWGFKQSDSVTYPGFLATHIWMQNVTLMVGIRRWQKIESRLWMYVHLYNKEYEQLSAVHDRLCMLARTYFDFFSAIPPETPSSKPEKELIVRIGRDFGEQCKDLNSRIRAFIASGVLWAGKTHAARRRILGSLGFQSAESVLSAKRHGLSFDSFTIVALYVIMISGAIGLIFRTSEGTAYGFIVWSAQLSLTICLSIWVAIFLKTVWPHANSGRSITRPYAAYLISGLLAYILWDLVALAFLAISLQSFGEAFLRFLHKYIPQGLHGFTIAFFVAFLSDNKIEKIGASRMRWVEGISMALACTVTAFLLKIDFYQAILSPDVFLLWPVIGLFIGLTIPSSFRKDTPRWEEAPPDIANPFSVGSPVFDTKRFFGRRDVIKRILQGLLLNHFYVHGARRSGKTSLLRVLARELEVLKIERTIFHPVSIDLQAVPERNLFSALGNSLVDSLRYLKERGGMDKLDTASVESIDKKLHDRLEDADEFLSLFDVVDEITTTWSSDRIIFVLLIDEFEKMNEFQLNTREQFRSLFMTEDVDNLRLIATGGHLKIWDRSSPFNFMKEIHLGPLSASEAKELILNTSDGVVTWEDSALELILEISGGEPYVIQQLCSEVVDQAMRRQIRKVDKDIVEKIDGVVNPNVAALG